MKPIVNLMTSMWNMTDIDWLGYQLNKEQKFIFHHIHKREHGGKVELNNGAILCGGVNSHQYLHIIECKDYELFVYLNNMLKTINNQREMPNKQQLLAIDNIFKQFEREYCGYRNSRGELLIKEEYTKRLIK